MIFFLRGSGRVIGIQNVKVEIVLQIKMSREKWQENKRGKKRIEAGTGFFLNVIFSVNWLLWEIENFLMINEEEHLSVRFNICRENKDEEYNDIYNS